MDEIGIEQSNRPPERRRTIAELREAHRRSIQPWHDAVGQWIEESAWAAFTGQPAPPMPVFEEVMRAALDAQGREA